MPVRKHIRDIKRIVKSEGATLVSITEGKHLLITAVAEGREFSVVAGKTPSCWRSARNLKAQIRREMRREEDH